MIEERALTVTEDLAPRMVMTVQQALANLAQFKEFVKAVMEDGTDYGVIPGTKKPTLYKPGAEKLCEIYGFTPEVEVTHRVEDWETGFFHYECTCRLVSRRTGMVQAIGVGSCNTKEKRYSDRWVFASEVPDGVDRNTLQRREGTGKNGRPYTQYLWKNDDIYTLVNTILKMAKKRALVDATLSATRSSGMFTQDVEDWVDNDPAEHATATPTNRTQARPNASEQVAQAKVGPKNLWPAIPKFTNFKTLKDWANQYFNITEEQTLREANVKRQEDFTSLEELQEVAIKIRATYGKDPNKAEAVATQEVPE